MGYYTFNQGYIGNNTPVIISNNLQLLGNATSLSAGPTGVFKVLLASPDSVAWVQDVATSLTNSAYKYPDITLQITQVSAVDTLPTVTVGQYDAILFWSDANVSWNSSFDTHSANNGGLVTGQFFASTGITGITSNLMPTVNKSGGQAGGIITWPAGPYAHPIANGADSNTQKVSSFVSAVSGGGYAAVSPTLSTGAATVITSVEGSTKPFVVVRDPSPPNGRTVFLNFFPVSNRSGGFSAGWNPSIYPDGGLLLLNALLWSARKL